MNTRVFHTDELAERWRQSLQTEAAAFVEQHGRPPTLAVILVGGDAASALYVSRKGEACRLAGVNALDFSLDPKGGFEALEAMILGLNGRPDIDGILVQFPLPKGWSEKRVISLIDPAKDVDGFHPLNAGHLLTDANDCLATGLPPCTPAGVMEILHDAKIPLAGRRAVVIGRSSIVGKPMAQMLLAADATVTICHSRTQELAAICREADVLVAALGRPNFVTADFVKPGAAVVDVGISRVEVAGRRRVVGDVDAKAVQGIASFLTPVPRGVGPMTIVMLVRNTIRAARKRNAKQ